MGDMETTMKGNRYKSKLSNEIYLVEYRSRAKGYVKLVCMNFPYTRVQMNTHNLKQYYKLITKENQ